MNRSERHGRAAAAATRTLIFLLAFAAGFGAALLVRGAGVGTFRRPGGDADAEARAEGVPGAVPAGHRVLLDIRRRGAPSRIWSDEELRAANVERAATSRRVFNAVFPGGHLVIHSHCSAQSVERMAQTEAELARARSEGQFDPDLIGHLPGNFTGPRAGETLYAISVNECNAQSGPLAQGSMQLAVYSGDTLRASVNTLHGGTIYAVQDVDDDGVDEVLLGKTTYGEQSGAAITLRLVSLKGGELQLIHDFGAVMTYEPPFPFGAVTHVPHITYLPGGPGRAPQFRVNVYRLRCYEDEGCEGWPRPEVWERVASSGGR